MKNESDDIHELVEALREDLPSERDAARIRARLAGFGVALGAGLTGSEALASLAGAKAAASAGTAGLWSQIGALSWGAKLGVAAAVSVSAVSGPLIVAKMESNRAPVPAASAARKAAVVRSADASSNAPSRALNAPASPDRPALDATLNAPAPTADTMHRDVARAEDVLAPSSDRPARAAARSGASHRPKLDAESAPVAPVATLAAPANAPSLAAASLPAASTATVAAEPSATAAPNELPSPIAATTLAEETRLIDGAFSALRARDRDAAERFVHEHELRFPNGMLRRERERARAALLDRR